jgi:hypothetical protein
VRTNPAWRLCCRIGFQANFDRDTLSVDIAMATPEGTETDLFLERLWRIADSLS